MNHIHTFDAGKQITLRMDGGEVVVKGSASARHANLIGQARVTTEGDSHTVEGQGSLVLNLPSHTHLTIESGVNNVVVRDLRHVTLGEVEGNLVLSHVGTLEVESSLQGEVALNQIEQPLRLNAVEGNLMVNEAADLTIERVEGNAALRHVGVLVIDQLEANLTVSDAASLAVERIEGNSAIRRVSGAITLGTVEGNLALSAPGPEVTVEQVEGNIAMEGALPPGGSYRLSSEGDIHLHLTGHVRLVAHGMGEVESGPTVRRDEAPQDEGYAVYWIGEGEDPATVELTLSGGRLSLNQGEPRVRYTWGEGVRWGTCSRRCATPARRSAARQRRCAAS